MVSVQLLRDDRGLMDLASRRRGWYTALDGTRFRTGRLAATLCVRSLNLLPDSPRQQNSESVRGPSLPGGPVYDLDLHRDWLLSLVDLPSGGALLDVGCGRGADLAALASRIRDPRARFVGIDASDHAARAQGFSHGRVEFVQAKVGPDLGFDDETFDVLLTQEVLECFPNLDAFVPELARVLRPGGQIVASENTMSLGDLEQVALLALARIRVLRPSESEGYAAKRRT